jgi:hypothetical protein
MLMGELALTIYFVNSMVSFQQVMNAPLLFLMLGICEKNLTKETETVYNRPSETDEQKEV